jgi:CRP-like cAMP-binding protein
MELENAREIISEYLKTEFGKIVELRDISVIRRSSGRVWNGRLYCVTRDGDIEVGTIGVTEERQIISDFGIDQLVASLRSTQSAAVTQDSGSGSPFDSEDDFSDLGFGDDSVSDMADLSLDDNDGNAELSELDNFFSDVGEAEIRTKVSTLLESNEQADLLSARRLMPQLLVDPDGRGAVLKQMAELEFRLNETELGQGYLEAAAREFADRADIGSIESCAVLTAGIIGASAFETHPIKILLDQTYAKLTPVPNIEEVLAFDGLGDEAMFEIKGAAQRIEAMPGTDLLREGDPAVQAFVIKSGVVEIKLEAPDGGLHVVRCCFPGEFVGESSVLEKNGATCNATVTTQTDCTLWRFDGTRLQELVQESGDIKSRIEAARAMHRLDSFFSMNTATDTLDARVRDRLLRCIVAIRHFRAGEVLSHAGSVPEAVYLVATGRVEYHRPNLPPRVYEPDDFVGLSDTLHELQLEADIITAMPCRLIQFDIAALKKLAHDAPPEVVAVLERLD